MQPLEALLFRGQRDIDPLAAAQNGRGQAPDAVGDEHQQGIARRLLQRLEQAVGGRGGHGIGWIDDGHLAPALIAREAQRGDEIPNLLDTDGPLVLRGREPVKIGVLRDRQRKRRFRVRRSQPQAAPGKPGRGTALTRALGSHEHQCVRHAALANAEAPPLRELS